MSYAASWSGGKDGCFACYEAMRSGYDISHLVNFLSGRSKRVRFHGTEARLVRLQAEAIGIPLLQKGVAWSGYEELLKRVVRPLIPDGVEGMVFGDIHLQGHKDWVERVCGELGIKALEPLWGRDPETILLGFMDAGFEATIVSARRDLFDEGWIGRRVDGDFLRYLKDNDIDVCGENGEYHTFVTDGPTFKKRVRMTKGRPVRKGRYWLLSTTQPSRARPFSIFKTYLKNLYSIKTPIRLR